jgi:ATP-dependent HslUV protease, peptidase subunit HslV
MQPIMRRAVSAAAPAFRPTSLAPLSSSISYRGTTILAVRKGDSVCVVGDGQVTMGGFVVKNNARKVRRMGPEDRVVAGFAGATADALALFERLEAKLEEHPDQLLRACVSMAKDWRMDKYLRRLDAMLLVCDKDISLYLTGTGDVLEPPDGVIGIGSGGTYAVAAARALVPVDVIDGKPVSAEDIARRAMEIAAELCIYTNNHFIVETISRDSAPTPAAQADASDLSFVQVEGAGGGGSDCGSGSDSESSISESSDDDGEASKPPKPTSKAGKKQV